MGPKKWSKVQNDEVIFNLFCNGWYVGNVLVQTFEALAKLQRGKLQKAMKDIVIPKRGKSDHNRSNQRQPYQ